MSEEKRKCPRYDLLGNVEVENVSSIGESLIKNFSRGGFCAVFDNFDYKVQSTVKVKLQAPPKETPIDIIGDIVWKRQIDGKCYAGLKFKEIDKTAKMDILDYAYKQWRSNLHSKE